MLIHPSKWDVARWKVCVLGFRVYWRHSSSSVQYLKQKHMENKHNHSQSLYGQEPQSHTETSVTQLSIILRLSYWGHISGSPLICTGGQTDVWITASCSPVFQSRVTEGSRSHSPLSKEWKKNLLEIYRSTERVCRVMWWISGMQQVARPHYSEVCIYTSVYLCDCLCEGEHKKMRKEKS